MSIWDVVINKDFHSTKEHIRIALEKKLGNNYRIRIRTSETTRSTKNLAGTESTTIYGNYLNYKGLELLGIIHLVQDLQKTVMKATPKKARKSFSDSSRTIGCVVDEHGNLVFEVIFSSAVSKAKIQNGKRNESVAIKQQMVHFIIQPR